MNDIVNKMMGRVSEIGKSPVMGKLMQGAGALQGSIEDASGPADLITNPATGKEDAATLGLTALRSAGTAPVLQKYMDKFLESEYGAYLPVLAENPNIKQFLHRNPYLKTGVGMLSDRLDRKKFEYMRGNALNQMSSAAGQLEAQYGSDTASLGGYSAVADAVNRRMRINPYASFDTDNIVKAAQELKKYRTGEELTPEELTAAKDAAQKAYDRGFKPKGLHRVYSRYAGGLSGQRYRSAMDELAVRGTNFQQRVQAGGAALGEANSRIQEVASMQGPEARVRGPRVNVGRFMELYNKGADKKSNAESGDSVFLDMLSTRDFQDRSSGTVLTRYKRSLDEKGGASAYANSLIYSGGDRKEPSKSLEQILKKLKKELYFKENVLYTVDGK